MPRTYRRPAPAATALARARVARLHGPSPDPLSWASATAVALDSVEQVVEPVRTDDPVAAAPAEADPPGWLRRHLPDRLIPVAFRAARLDPGRRGVVAVALVALLAGAVAGYAVWRSRPRPIAVAMRAPAASRFTAVRVGPTVVVAVAGAVRRPGLFTLPAGARVADALRAAGGVRPGVSIGLLNLARRLVDGEQVVVGAAAPPAGGPAPASGGPGPPLDLNTATVAQLDALPGIGPVLAARIVAYRTQHGAFRSVDQLRDVTGIGDAKFADLRSLVTA